MTDPFAHIPAEKKVLLKEVVARLQAVEGIAAVVAQVQPRDDRIPQQSSALPGPRFADVRSKFGPD